MPEIRNTRSSVRVAFSGATTTAKIAQTSMRVLVKAYSQPAVAQAHLRVPVRIGTVVAAVAQMSLRILGEIIPEAPLSNVGVWNGTDWDICPVKYWNGTAFVDSEATNSWNGTAWA